MANTKKIMSGVLFYQLLSSVLTLALLLLSFNQYDEIDSALIEVFNVMVFYLLLCTIFCYYSELFTENSYAIGDKVYESLWYQMPVDVQQLLILITAQSNTTFQLTGFGIVDCSLATLLSVCGMGHCNLMQLFDGGNSFILSRAILDYSDIVFVFFTAT